MTRETEKKMEIEEVMKAIKKSNGKVIDRALELRDMEVYKHAREAEKMINTVLKALSMNGGN